MNEVSIIIPVYNVEKYISRCIESVLNQTYTNFELILVDDGSPDKSGEICEEYAKTDPRIKVIHKPNGGVSSARNAGLDAASGEYIAFVDSDDFIHPQYLDILTKAIHKSGSDMATLNITRVTNEFKCIFTKVCYDTIQYSIHNKPDIQTNLYNYVYNPSLQNSITCGLYSVAKSSIFNKIRFINEIKMAEDIEFMVRISPRIRKSIHLNVPFYFYQCDNTSLTRSKINNSQLTSLLALDHIIKFLQTYQNSEVHKFEYRLFCNYFDLGYKVAIEKQRELSQNYSEYKQIMKHNMATLFSNPYMSLIDKSLLIMDILKLPTRKLLFAKNEQYMLETLNSLLDSL